MESVECQQLQSVSVKRLFLLNRAQRNFVAGLASFIGVAALDLLGGWLNLAVPTLAIILVVLLLAMAVLFMDVIVESLGTFWTKPSEPPVPTARAVASADVEPVRPPKSDEVGGA